LALIGAALTGLCGVGVMPAAAQRIPDTTVQGPPQKTEVRPRAVRPQQSIRAEDDLLAEPRRPQRQQRGQRGDGDREDQPTDGDERIPSRDAPQPPQVDGEQAAEGEQPPVQDGVAEVGEPLPVEDGDSGLLDSRPLEDRNAFDAPPAGFDALAFQIDDLDPILDRRPQRLFRFEPYDPLGIRRGSWVIFPEVETALNASNNVRRARQREGDYWFDVRPRLRAVTDWRQHAVELRATGLVSQFADLTSENDRAYSFEARGRLDISKRTNIETLVLHERTQDSRGSRQAPSNAAERADIDTNRAVVALNHRFNRLGVQIRGAITDVDYAPVPDNSGNIIVNKDRDYRQYDTAARLSWQFKPSLSAFVEFANNVRAFDAPSQGDGILRDSKGERYRAGLSFGNTGQFLRGEIGAGWGIQRPDDARLASIEGIIVDANLAYRMSALTTIAFNAQSDFADATNPGSGGALTRRVGVEARHAFRRELIATAGLSHQIADYKGIDLVEKETSADLGLEYFVNRNVTAFGAYQHLWFTSNVPQSSYQADTVRVGVRVRQ
jgi:hypothetical protein